MAPKHPVASTDDFDSVSDDDSSIISLDSATHIAHGDELRNINSHEYLAFIASKVPGVFSNKEIPPLDEYDSTFPYGDYYTQFLLHIEEACEKAKTGVADPILDSIVRAIFENDNTALERTAAMTKVVLEKTIHTSSAVEKKVAERLENRPPSSPIVNALSPERADSIGVKMGPMISAMVINQTKKDSVMGAAARARAKTGVADFKPMTTTSQVSIRRYRYQTNDSPMELRMGTQAQYHQGEARMNPIFERRLQSQKSEIIAAKEQEIKSIETDLTTPTVEGIEQKQKKIEQLKKEISALKSDQAITHVYFNNLGRDSEGLSMKGQLERGFENNLTRQLHLAELNNNNLAVITLPADKGFLDKKLLTDDKKESCKNAFDKFLAVAEGKSREPIQDFFISDKVQKLLYGKDGRGMVNEAERNKKLTELLNISFKKVLGVDNPSGSTDQFSQAQLQAVYFHFIKFELTDFILEKLQPNTFNTSCKDGIDRGGVSSAYYNLMKSLETSNPLDKDEFYRALHAAPTLVKGRAMNHHTKLIWNAVDKYLAGNDKLPDTDPNKKQVPEWLVEWRNKNVPEKMEATPLSDRWLSAAARAESEPKASDDKQAVRTALLAALGQCRTMEEKNEGIIAYLKVCKLEKVIADLSGLDCSGFNFTGVDLSHANLSGTNLTGANLSSANLTGVNLTGANLNNITIDEKTVWKDIKEFKNVACNNFHFKKTEDTQPDRDTRGFIQAFKANYAPPHRFTILMGPTEVTRFINNADNTNGSKLVYLLSHAEEKPRFFGEKNNTRRAIDNVIAVDRAANVHQKIP